MAAENQRSKADSAPDKKRTDPFGRMDLVTGNGKEVDIQFIDIYFTSTLRKGKRGT